MAKTQINLLSKSLGGRPPSSFRRFFRPSFFVLLFAVIFIGFEIAFLVTFYHQLDGKEEAFKQKQIRLKMELDSVQKEFVKLKSQKEEVDSTKNVSDLLERLKSDGHSLVKILETVSQNLPSQAWIHALSQKDKYIVVNGFASDNEAISHFLSQLKKSHHFKNVKLVITEQFSPKSPLKKFTINCEVKVSPKESEEKT